MNKLSQTSRIIRIASALGLVLAAALLAACSQQPSAQTAPAKPTKPASSAPAESPSVKLVEPVAGATVPAGTVKVAVEAQNLDFVMPSNNNVSGQGHVHFTLDDRPFQMSVEKTFEFKDVAPGKHRLVAELVQNNTDPFEPPAKQEIEFTAK